MVGLRLGVVERSQERHGRYGLDWFGYAGYSGVWFSLAMQALAYWLFNVLITC